MDARANDLGELLLNTQQTKNVDLSPALKAAVKLAAESFEVNARGGGVKPDYGVYIPSNTIR